MVRFVHLHSEDFYRFFLDRIYEELKREYKAGQDLAAHSLAYAIAYYILADHEAAVSHLETVIRGFAWDIGGTLAMAPLAATELEMLLPVNVEIRVVRGLDEYEALARSILTTREGDVVATLPFYVKTIIEDLLNRAIPSTLLTLTIEKARGSSPDKVVEALRANTDFLIKEQFLPSIVGLVAHEWTHAVVNLTLTYYARRRGCTEERFRLLADERNRVSEYAANSTEEFVVDVATNWPGVEEVDREARAVGKRIRGRIEELLRLF